MRGPDIERYQNAIRWTLFAWLVVLIVTLRLSGMTLAFAEIRTEVSICSGILLGGMLYRPGRWPVLDKGVVFVESAALFASVALLGHIQSYVVAASTSGYIDRSLIGFDRITELDWLSYWTFCHAHPLILSALDRCYHSLGFSPLARFAVLSARGRSAACYRFVLVFAVALAATDLIFLFTPAKSAAVQYLGMHAPNLPRAGVDHIPVIEQLRAGRMRVIHLATSTGLIAFPSFHAALAVIFCWASRETGIVRPLIVVPNVVMLLATPIQGGHYFAEVVAGLLVALSAIGVVDRVFRRAPVVMESEPGLLATTWR